MNNISYIRTKLEPAIQRLSQSKAALEARFSPQKLRVAVFIACGVLFLAVAGVGVLYAEYRTNLIAQWVGYLLDKSNRHRSKVGAMWQRLEARAEVKGTLEEAGAPEVPMSGGLPEAVARARFEMERVPEDGLPSFIAIWRTPLDGKSGRETPEMVESVRVFKRGLSLLKAMQLPDVRYRTQVQAQVGELYRQVGDFEWNPEEDSLGVADSVRVAVQEELAVEFMEQLRLEEHQRLLADYRAGRINQVLIQSGVGIYHGELIYHDLERASVAFDMKAERMAEVLGITGENP